ncbi:MAG: hypothetical protein SGARI_003032, partial [Bacillariaceae sp.]
MKPAYQAVYDAFIPIATAAGNTDGQPADNYLPGCFTYTDSEGISFSLSLNVGGINESSRGIAPSSSIAPGVDVWAPGDGVESTSNGGGYGKIGGTSAAAPHAAGAMALRIATIGRPTSTAE